MNKALRRFARRLFSIQRRMRNVPEEEVDFALLPDTAGTRGADASFTATYVYRPRRAFQDPVLERIWDNESDNIFDTM
jgi:transposase